MMRNKILTLFRNNVPYIKELRQLSGSVTASILMQQLDYWFEKKPGGFYKFLEPCENNELYKTGDSWTEELGFSKYEFKTALDVENKTKVDNTGLFADGVNTAHDVPALFTIGAAYKIIPELTASVGYHHFFDKSAGMANDKQKTLKGGTNEYLFGLEYKINKIFLISGGGQITRYGLSNDFQSDLSFYVSSYSLGFGGAANVSDNVQINVGYFYTDYDNYKKSLVVSGQAAGTNDYTRKNKVFAVGVDFSF